MNLTRETNMISTLDAIQKGGFGAASMDLAEKLATEEPYNGKLMVLDTVQEELQMSQEGQKHIYEDNGIPAPKVGIPGY